MIYIPLIVFYAGSLLGIIIISSFCINNCIDNCNSITQVQPFQQQSPETQSIQSPGSTQSNIEYIEVAPKYEDINTNRYDKPPDYDYGININTTNTTNTTNTN
jgi:hypothetical protein